MSFDVLADVSIEGLDLQIRAENREIARERLASPFDDVLSDDLVGPRVKYLPVVSVSRQNNGLDLVISQLGHNQVNDEIFLQLAHLNIVPQVLH